LTQVLLFAANTNLGYRIFSCANKKFTFVICYGFHKIICHGALLWWIQLQTEKFSWHIEPDFSLFALALQIVSV